jgi:hypothetical protein
MRCGILLASQTKIYPTLEKPHLCSRLYDAKPKSVAVLNRANLTRFVQQMMESPRDKRHEIFIGVYEIDP